MFISTAYAQTAIPSIIGGEGLMSFLPLIFIIGVFYFLIIRPQSTRAKEHVNMLSTIRRGDKVLTSGGFHATVEKVVDETILQLEIAEGTIVTVEKQSIVKVVVKSTDATDAKSVKQKARAGKKAAK